MKGLAATIFLVVAMAAAGSGKCYEWISEPVAAILFIALILVAVPIIGVAVSLDGRDTSNQSGDPDNGK